MTGHRQPEDLIYGITIILGVTCLTLAAALLVIVSR